MTRLLALLLVASSAFSQIRVWPRPGKSPLVTLRVVFTTGSAQDPEGKPGVAYLTAQMLSEGGTRQMTYKQIVDAIFPMATSLSSQVDKEMTAFWGSTHVDNLDAYYRLFHDMLLDPGWREDDFKRVKEDAINFLRVGLRGNNDEELAKEALYNEIYQGTVYGHDNSGTISSLEKITLKDLKDFYAHHYTQNNLMIGIAGGYSEKFLAQLKQDFRKLPRASGFAPRFKPPQPIDHSRAVLIDKDTRSVAYSIGFPLHVKRGDPDYVALLLASTYFGQHRSSGGHLYQRMRELRGFNYGDYSYIEYFPRGMFQFEPSPNLVRRDQIFQIWIRPVEPPTAVFALRLALYELDKLIKEGLTEEEFERTRSFLSKYINLLTRTKRAELGYSLDSLYYGIPDYAAYVKAGLARLNRNSVNQAIRRNLRPDRLIIVAVAKNAAELESKLLSGETSPMTYNSPKPPEILAEDKIVEKWNLGLRPQDVRVVPVDQVFE